MNVIGLIYFSLYSVYNSIGSEQQSLKLYLKVSLNHVFDFFMFEVIFTVKYQYILPRNQSKHSQTVEKH
jgi:hypothetical protein